MNYSRLFLLTAITVNSWQVLADDQLKGTIIGTAEAVDYSTNSKSTTVNTRPFSPPMIEVTHGQDLT